MASVQVSTPHVGGVIKGLPSRDSMAFTTTKGLLNGPGQNNCFLNSAVQVLWHLDIFRRSFRDLSGHACMAESCIFCALKELFSQLQFSNETALPPDALRRALAESFFDQQRFQLGFMDDAAECFENILMRIHTHIAQGVAEDMCNVRQCIPHQKFAMTLVEQSICGACQATSEPLSFTQMVHYVSASALTTQGRQTAPNGRKLSITDTFGELLRKAGSMGDIRDCPSSCGAKIQISRTLMNRPEIVSIGIVWDSERPTLEHIMDVFSTVGTTLKLGDVFHKVVDNRWAEITTHNLVGVVTYYGKHYSTFFFHTKFRVWIYFDDATVREIGARWEQVVEKCRRGRHQPLLLLYAVPNGTPVTMESVQQATSMYEKNKVDNQAILRRSVTPSPEKPNIGNTRRAITPNPDSTLGQKNPIPRLYNEYQNLSIIQDNIYGRTTGSDVVDGEILRKNAEQPKTVSVHRTPSNGSSSGVESFNMPDHIPIIRRRDSGNWSGDRNSASSASSTTMENPYLYLLGKIPHHNNNNNGSNSIPSSPTRKTDHLGNSIYDAGYDSYSLSSNDSSSMNTIQHLMKMGHLAKIPEDYSNLSEKPTQNCDTLCNEADELLKKSRHFEDEHDLVLALALCNAAATKARAAMNAPYNNPQTLTLARMKYNTCIMRARSLHRRMTQTPTNTQKDPLPEIRHTREGSSGSGKHSRQNSRDKTHQLSSSRQNSRELLVPPESGNTKSQSPQKSIEIYATLPKKKDTLKNKVNINFEEDSEYVLYDKPPAREPRSIFSKSKNKESKESKMREKRSRSEDRNKMSRDFSIAPEILVNKDTLKREKVKEEKEEKKEKDGKNKKQHKIRRKLLMGGLIKRKNRSMPDLTDTNENDPTPKEKPVSSVDDSNIGIKNENLNTTCGYLSEGHLEFTANTTNPTLERSKLMRKSFHGSAGKVLTAAKVPPPPPLRTTSQLSAITKLPGSEVVEEDKGGKQYNHHMENNSNYYNYNQFPNEPTSLSYGSNPNQPNPAPIYNHQRTGSHDVLIYQTRDAAMGQVNTVVTQAEVHQVQSPIKNEDYYVTSNHQVEDEGIDEVDCCLPALTSLQNLELPPYPSPSCSVIHSRQASEDFPPPPPPLDLSALEEHLPEINKPSTLLAELQNKRQEILSQENNEKPFEVVKSGDTWLKELQAKQAALRQKKALAQNLDAINVQKEQSGGDGLVKSSVKDLASRFENKLTPSLNTTASNGEVTIGNQPELLANHYHPQDPHIHSYSPIIHGINGNLNNFIPRDSKGDNTVQTGVLSLKKREDTDILAPENSFHPQNQPHHQFEMQKEESNLHHQLQRTNSDGDDKKCKSKKKSVSFCDQVILVATAEEQEDDSYIPNPILERVLRTAMNKPEAAAIRQEIALLRQNEGKVQDDVIQMAKEQNYGDQSYQQSHQLQNHQVQNVQLQNMQIQNHQIQNHQVQNHPVQNHQVQNHQVQNHQVQNHQIQTHVQNHQVQNVPVQNHLVQNQVQNHLLHQQQNNHQQPNNQVLNQNYQQPPQLVYVSRQNSLDNLLLSSTPKLNGQQSLDDYNRINDTRQVQRPREDFGNSEGRYQVQENVQRTQMYGQSSQLAQHRQSPYQMLSPSQNYVSLAQNNAQNSSPRYGFQSEQLGHNTQYVSVPPRNQEFVHQVNQGRNFTVQNNQQEFTQNQSTRSNTTYPPITRQNALPYSCQSNYHPGFQHPPSPSPSNQSYSTQSSYNSSQNSGNRQINLQQNQNPYGYTTGNQQYSPVQRVAPQIDYNSIQHFNHQNSSPYQRVPSREDQLISNITQNSLYQRVPSTDQINQFQNRSYNQFNQGQTQPQAHLQNQGLQNNGDYVQNNPPSPYQRVPDPTYPAYQQIPPNYQQKYSPYQQVLPQKQQPALKKTVSFEPGTKGGAEASPKAVVTPIIVNNNSNYSAKTKCNLCRKKHVVAPNLYCTDCEFYMSRFKPKS